MHTYTSISPILDTTILDKSLGLYFPGSYISALLLIPNPELWYQL